MRIAYLSAFFPFRGGIRQFNDNLATELQQQGHEVRAYTFSRQYPELLFPGTSQYSEEAQDPTGLNPPRLLDSLNPLSWWKTAKTIQKFQPELLVMRFWLPFFGPCLGFVAGYLKKRGCTTIAIVDNAKPHEYRPGDRAFTQYFLKRCSGLISMGEQVTQDLKDLAPRRKPLRLVHPLYDHYGEKVPREEAHAQLGLDPSKTTLLYFGFIRKYKGVDNLIEAFGHLDDSYQLVLAGEPYVDWEPYEQAIAQNPNRERIKLFVRYIHGEEIPLLFSAADIMTLPYQAATQSGVLAMSAHYELPTVATAVGSLPETVADLGCGVTVPPKNPPKLAEAIAKIKEEGQAEAIKNNIRQAKKRYSWEYFAKELVSYSQKLTKNGDNTN